MSGDTQYAGFARGPFGAFVGVCTAFFWCGDGVQCLTGRMPGKLRVVQPGSSAERHPPPGGGSGTSSGDHGRTGFRHRTRLPASRNDIFLIRLKPAGLLLSLPPKKVDKESASSRFRLVESRSFSPAFSRQNTTFPERLSRAQQAG